MKADIIVTSNNSVNFNYNYLQENCRAIDFQPSLCCFEAKTSDLDKVDNIKAAMASPNQIILALRGGAGATRLMNQLQDLKPPSCPKIFIGYSDLTVLLNYLQKFEHIQLIHGPMAFELNSVKQIEKFQNALSKQDVVFEQPAKWYKQKPIGGKVIGGNLMLMVDMLGTFYEPDFQNKVLLIEEIDEAIDKLDRMFARLRDSGKLAQISGIILGNFNNCASKSELKILFDTYLSDLDIGILYDVNLGHVSDSDYIHLHTDLKIDETGIYYQ
ncbi:LD-carboxypeptidase [Mollicutes bacterium LVI A0039]|nr:LD-carboxypeptidase [Mollicutes bacterium LVI A0039]